MNVTPPSPTLATTATSSRPSPPTISNRSRPGRCRGPRRRRATTAPSCWPISARSPWRPPRCPIAADPRLPDQPRPTRPGSDRAAGAPCSTRLGGARASLSPAAGHGLTTLGHRRPARDTIAGRSPPRLSAGSGAPAPRRSRPRHADGPHARPAGGGRAPQPPRRSASAAARRRGLGRASRPPRSGAACAEPVAPRPVARPPTGRRRQRRAARARAPDRGPRSATEPETARNGAPASGRRRPSPLLLARSCCLAARRRARPGGSGVLGRRLALIGAVGGRDGPSTAIHARASRLRRVH